MKIPTHSEQATLLQFNSRIKKLSQVTEPAEKTAASDKALRDAAQDFESLFLHQLMKTMRSTVSKAGLFHGGLSEEIFTDMFDQEVAKAAAERGVGIADLLYQQLRRTEG